MQFLYAAHGDISPINTVIKQCSQRGCVMCGPTSQLILQELETLREGSLAPLQLVNNGQHHVNFTENVSFSNSRR